MTQQTVAVIGGGAAGLAAAVSAAECGDAVVVLERMDRIGRKLLATGNGRCNLMNTGEPRYWGDPAFARAVMSNCGAEAQCRFWHGLGLALREEDEGRVYPADGMAATVLDTLRFTLERQGVDIRTNYRAARIDTDNRGRWLVEPEDPANNTFLCDRVIVAGGGKAQPKLGSDGSAYNLLRYHDHRLVDPMPALTQIETDTDEIRGLAGIRIRGGIRVMRGGHVRHEERGEFLFTEYGVSGICAMQCARWTGLGTELSLDLASGLGYPDSHEAFLDLQRRRDLWTGRPAERLLTGLYPPRLANRLMSILHMTGPGLTADDLPDGRLRALAGLIHDFRLPVQGIRGFDSAQVTAGGIAPKDFDPATMESRRVPGLHAAGEVLDVDGDCGGFNLMFAFGSGILAGLNGRKKP